MTGGVRFSPGATQNHCLVFSLPCGPEHEGFSSLIFHSFCIKKFTKRHIYVLLILFWSCKMKGSLFHTFCLLLPPAGRRGNFIHMQLTDRDAPSKTGGENSEEDKVARLISPSISTQDTSLCMSFWYHLSTEHKGALLVKCRRGEETTLWVSDKHQGSRWREGRVPLPRSSHSYQVNLDLSHCRNSVFDFFPKHFLNKHLKAFF